EVLYGATKIGTTVGLSGDQLLGTLKFRTLSSGAAQINLNSVDYYSPKLELTSDKGINLIQSVSITSGTTQNPPGGDTAPSTGGSSSAGTKTFDQEKLNINPVVNNTSGQASAGVSKEEMDKLIELAKKNGTELTINVAQAAGAKSYELAIPQSFGEAAEEGLQIKLVTE